jgi:hypothetical protein
MAQFGEITGRFLRFKSIIAVLSLDTSPKKFNQIELTVECREEDAQVSCSLENLLNQ